MQNLKRVLSLVTTLAILLGVMSVAVFAEDGTSALTVTSEAELKAALEDESVDTINLADDFSINGAIAVNRSVTINGNGHTLTAAPDKSGTPSTRMLRVMSDDVTLNLSGIVFDGDGKAERGVQVDSNLNANLNIDGCTIKNVTHYAVNMCGGTTVGINIENSDITSWGALNLWGQDYTVVVKNSTLNGVNDKTYNKDGWNDFATVVMEGDTTGKTTEHSENCTVILEDCTVISDQRTGNEQANIGFNEPSAYNTVKIIGDKTRFIYATDKTYLEYGAQDENNPDANHNVLIISGGTFSDNSIVPFLAEGFSSYQTVGDDSTFTVAPTAGYRVVFLDGDGRMVNSQTLEYGAMPTAPAATKQSDGVYVYSFAGWDKAIDAVTGDATYTARFNATLIPVEVFERDYEIIPNNTPVAATTTIEEELVPLAELPADFEVKINAEDVADFAATLGIVNDAADFDAKAEIAGNAMVEALAAVTAESKTEIDVAAIAETAGIDLNAPVTREQIVTALFTLAEAQGFDVSARSELAQFADADDISDYAQAAIQWAISVGLLKGGDAGTLAPGGVVTQEQLVILLLRFAELTK